MAGWVKRRVDAVFDTVLDHFWLDLVWAVGAPVLGAAAASQWPAVDVLAHLPLMARVSLYSDFMTLSSTMGAGIGVAFPIYLALSGRRVDQIKRVLGDRLMRMWLWALIIPWPATEFLSVCKVTDAGKVHPTNWVHLGAVGAAIPVVLAGLRVLYVFYKLADLQRKPPPPALTTAARPIGMRETVGRPSA